MWQWLMSPSKTRIYAKWSWNLVHWRRRRCPCQSSTRGQHSKGIYISHLRERDISWWGASNWIVSQFFRAEIIALAHEGHQGTHKTLHLLRQTYWFPGIGKLVKYFVESCIGCLAPNSYTRPVSLVPNLPDTTWQKLRADFKGPIRGQYYLNIIFDQYSKYPEIDIITSTSFKELTSSWQNFCSTWHSRINDFR